MAENFLSVSFINVEPDPVEQCNIMRKMHCGIATEEMSKAISGHHGWDKKGKFLGDGIFHGYTLEYLKWSSIVHNAKSWIQTTYINHQMFSNLFLYQ